MAEKISALYSRKWLQANEGIRSSSYLQARAHPNLLQRSLPLPSTKNPNIIYIFYLLILPVLT